MSVLRVVLDANVYISAALRPAGPPGQLIALLVADRFQVILTPAIVTELRRAFDYPRVRKVLGPSFDVDGWLWAVVVLADLVEDHGAARVCTDPDDDKYVAAAVEGRAQFVVTGDRGFLALTQHEGIRVVTPSAFLAQLLEA